MLPPRIFCTSAAEYPLAMSAAVSFGSFEASSIPIGIVAPSKSEPRPTWSTPATVTAWSMCSTIFSHDTAGKVPFSIASRVMRAVSSVEHASSPLQIFDILSSAATTPSKAKAWAVGLNWYLARAVKLVADYEHTTFTGGTATGNREAENFVVTRVQYAF